jgi:hypothetical protein
MFSRLPKRKSADKADSLTSERKCLPNRKQGSLRKRRGSSQEDFTEAAYSALLFVDKWQV